MVQLYCRPASPLITLDSTVSRSAGRRNQRHTAECVANVPAPYLQPGCGHHRRSRHTTPTATFTSNDATDYMLATAHTSLTVDASQTGKSTPLVTWPTPVAIQYGTALNSVQSTRQRATGKLAYTPAPDGA